MSKNEKKHPQPGDRKHQDSTEKGSVKEKNGINERAWGGVTEGYQPTKDVTSDPPTGGSGVPNKTKED